MDQKINAEVRSERFRGMSGPLGLGILSMNATLGFSAAAPAGWCRWLVVWSAIFLFAIPLTASSAAGQVVVLPSAQQFRMGGGVMVPDLGSARLGGNRATATGSARTSGLVPSARTTGNQLRASGLSVNVTIIDHAEIDRQLLGASPEEFVRRETVQRRQPSRVRSTPAVPLRFAEDDLQANETLNTELGKSFVRQGRNLHQLGHRRQSIQKYQAALPLLPPTLRQLAMRELVTIIDAGQETMQK